MITFPTILLRLVVALVLGACVGWEREYNEHNAGIRTIALVALGTALFTIISAFGFEDLLNYPHVQLDPTRIASYVVAGIGFLGGGSIFLQQDAQRVRGLTTAASIWVVAAIGMACGAGMLLEAVVATVLALLVLVGMRYVEATFLPFRAGHLQIVCVTIAAETGRGTVLGQIYDVFEARQIALESIEIRPKKNGDKNSEVLELACRSDSSRDLLSVVSVLKALPDVQEVQVQLRKATPAIE
jgi:putative Mg2+ transporter-C (MgtC) family protein